MQDSLRTEIVQGTHNELRIKPAPFKIQIHFYQVRTLGLFAALPDTFYKTSDKDEFPTCMMLGGIGVAEGMFNEDRSMYLAEQYDDGCNFWYYESMSDHRFDKVDYTSADTVIATRTVNVLNGSGRKPHKLKQQEKNLYLVFFDMGTEKCTTEGFELTGIPDRRYVKLIFSKN